ncbi:hypothetical protein TWF281_005965 [Arthrobotrys megalospora]
MPVSIRYLVITLGFFFLPSVEAWAYSFWTDPPDMDFSSASSHRYGTKVKAPPLQCTKLNRESKPFFGLMITQFGENDMYVRHDRPDKTEWRDPVRYVGFWYSHREFCTGLPDMIMRFRLDTYSKQSYDFRNLRQYINWPESEHEVLDWAYWGEIPFGDEYFPNQLNPGDVAIRNSKPPTNGIPSLETDYVVIGNGIAASRTRQGLQRDRARYWGQYQGTGSNIAVREIKLTFPADIPPPDALKLVGKPGDREKEVNLGWVPNKYVYPSRSGVTMPMPVNNPVARVQDEVVDTQSLTRPDPSMQMFEDTQEDPYVDLENRLQFPPLPLQIPPRQSVPPAINFNGQQLTNNRSPVLNLNTYSPSADRNIFPQRQYNPQQQNMNVPQYPSIQVPNPQQNIQLNLLPQNRVNLPSLATNFFVPKPLPYFPEQQSSQQRGSNLETRCICPAPTDTNASGAQSNQLQNQPQSQPADTEMSVKIEEGTTVNNPQPQNVGNDASVTQSNQLQTSQNINPDCSCPPLSQGLSQNLDVPPTAPLLNPGSNNYYDYPDRLDQSKYLRGTLTRAQEERDENRRLKRKNRIHQIRQNLWDRMLTEQAGQNAVNSQVPSGDAVSQSQGNTGAQTGFVENNESIAARRQGGSMEEEVEEKREEIAEDPLSQISIKAEEDVEQEFSDMMVKEEEGYDLGPSVDPTQYQTEVE